MAKKKKGKGGASRAREQRLVKVVREQAQRYMRVPNVTSVGVGYKRKKGREDRKTLCIQFSVDRKVRAEELVAEGIQCLPKSFEFDDGDSVTTDVVQRRYRCSVVLAEGEDLNEHDTRRSRLNPLRPGASVSHHKGTAGTLGAVVYDRDSDQALMLSNWHVLHGDAGQLGDSILQPGPYDGGQAGDACGRLLRSHLGLAGDCAVSTIEGRGIDPSVIGLDEVTPLRHGKAQLGDRVVKSGRTTGVTHGEVTRVGVVVKIHYGPQTGSQEIGGFEIRPVADQMPANGEVSMGGDSGSVWMIDGDDSLKDVVVGLHFAGEVDPHPDEEHAVACNIHSVLEKLRVGFVKPSGLESPARPAGSVCTCSPTPGGPQGSMPGPEGIGVPMYGNWCGPGHGSGTPIDDVDRACMLHDGCYGEHGYFNCGCDRRLVRDVGRALEGGNVHPWGRVMGPVMSAYFSHAPCRS